MEHLIAEDAAAGRLAERLCKMAIIASQLDSDAAHAKAK